VSSGTSRTAGAAVSDSSLGSTFICDQATGFVYDTELFSAIRTSVNTTLPLPYDAFWDASDKSFVAQYLAADDNTISTNVLSLRSGTTTDRLCPAFTWREHRLGFGLARQFSICKLQRIESGLHIFI